MTPIPTVWWLRPVSSAARVGAHSAVVWKRLYFRPPAASRSAVGVRHGPPNALEAPNPTSSSRTTSTLGAPAGGRSGSIGGNCASGSRASNGKLPLELSVRDGEAAGAAVGRSSVALLVWPQGCGRDSGLLASVIAPR